ncbi:hypothetical protein [Sphingomonas folli]|uniref:hypothetical protein n=1 Tax=Sphingomonas folli TaxID=2862497 RepID=UPI0021564DC6|nr:hypothetical protein [Sphingomonas folli]
MSDPVTDTRQHLWSLRTPGHEWPTAVEAPIHRDVGMDGLRRAATGSGLRGTVLVQSQPTDADTEWLLALARSRRPPIAAPVANDRGCAPSRRRASRPIGWRPMSTISSPVSAIG